MARCSLALCSQTFQGVFCYMRLDATCNDTHSTSFYRTARASKSVCIFTDCMKCTVQTHTYPLVATPRIDNLTFTLLSQTLKPHAKLLLSSVPNVQ